MGGYRFNTWRFIVATCTSRSGKNLSTSMQTNWIADAPPLVIRRTTPGYPSRDISTSSWECLICHWNAHLPMSPRCRHDLHQQQTPTIGERLNVGLLVRRVFIDQSVPRLLLDADLCKLALHLISFEDQSKFRLRHIYFCEWICKMVTPTEFAWAAKKVIQGGTLANPLWNFRQQKAHLSLKGQMA